MVLEDDGRRGQSDRRRGGDDAVWRRWKNVGVGVDDEQCSGGGEKGGGGRGCRQRRRAWMVEA